MYNASMTDGLDSNTVDSNSLRESPAGTQSYGCLYLLSVWTKPLSHQKPRSAGWP